MRKRWRKRSRNMWSRDVKCRLEYKEDDEKKKRRKRRRKRRR